MEELTKYREQIDLIDNQIIDLLSKRFLVVKQVWDFKKLNNIQPLQQNRWEEVLKTRKLKASKLNLDQNFIENIWEQIHKYALSLEK